MQVISEEYKVWEMLVKGFADLCPRKELLEWKLVLIGDGAIAGKLKRLVQELDIKDKVQIMPAMPKEDVLKIMEQARILLFNLKDDEVFKLTIPSKVFDYMLVGKPIIAGIPGEGRNILMRTGANILFGPDNVESFKKALLLGVKTLPELEGNAGKNRTIVMHEYTREKAAKELSDILRHIIGETIS